MTESKSDPIFLPVPSSKKPDTILSDFRPSNAAKSFKDTNKDCFVIGADGKTRLVNPTRQTKAMIKAFLAKGRTRQEILRILINGGVVHSPNTTGPQTKD
jgi:hypothetical protein